MVCKEAWYEKNLGYGAFGGSNFYNDNRSNYRLDTISIMSIDLDILGGVTNA